MADVSLPSKSRRLLNCDPRLYLRWQNGISILLRLMFEYIPRRYRNHTRPDAFGDQLFMRLDSEAYFAARRNKDQFGIIAGRVGKDVGTARDSGCRRVFRSVQCRQRLARKNEHRRLVTQLNDVAVSLGCFIRVTRSERHQSGNGA